MRAAVFFVGNKLMLDDGIGPAAYDLFGQTFEHNDAIDLFDVGCLTMDMLPYVEKYDFILTVDAVDDGESQPGTVFRFEPDAMARNCGATSSLHEMKLVDLFDAASLLGYQAKGYCVGMQIENMAPSQVTIGLTPQVQAALPLLVETAAAELVRNGFQVSKKKGE